MYDKIIEDSKQVIIDAQPQHMKILIEGELNQMLINYNTAAISALTDLKIAVLSQSHPNADWWSDELREAMEQADKLV